jgi:uncharacterized protein (UPF0248 family)
MPRLLRSSETALAIGSTVELDSGEVISTSIARSVLVSLPWRKQDGFLKRLFTLQGQKLYYEDNAYKNAGTALTLRAAYPAQASELNFKNPVLAAFSNAVWHCATAAKICIVLNEAASKSSADPENAAAMASMCAAYQDAKNWSPEPRLPTQTYSVVYSDGVTQPSELTEAELDRWARGSNEMNADKPSHQIVRIVDQQGRVVWGDR